MYDPLLFNVLLVSNPPHSLCDFPVLSLQYFLAIRVHVIYIIAVNYMEYLGHNLLGIPVIFGLLNFLYSQHNIFTFTVDLLYLQHHLLASSGNNIFTKIKY